ncbi:MAG: hypothetical protein AAFY76_00940 [Cyanobacteria bacterium J06649_11]
MLAAETANVQPVIDPTGCTNGDFELGDFSDGTWNGRYGSVQGGTGVLLESAFVNQLLPGAINSGDAHHTIVPRGLDPIVSQLPTTASSTSSYALRLGNAMWRNGAEMISKTFEVSPNRPTITFDYAVVLLNPARHSDNTLPTFIVRVRDSNGVELTGVTDLDGNGANFVRSNNSSFFNQSTVTINDAPIVYSDWLCGTINLSNYVGETVTVDFITKDCGANGGTHFAYAYLDNVCSGCENAPTSVAIDQVTSSECGAGKFCVDFTLPEKGNVVLNLRITTPDGTIVLEKDSPVLTDDSNPYCFILSDQENAQLSSAGENVNILVTGRFREGDIPLPSQFDAINGYPTRCSPFCCNYTNLIRNGDFPTPRLRVRSGFVQTASVGPNSIRPGMFGIITGAQANVISNSWFDVYETNSCSLTSGYFLAFNGQTSRCSGINAPSLLEIPQPPV